MKSKAPGTEASLLKDWLPFVTKVLAFIGLWQVLSNSVAWLNHWF